VEADNILAATEKAQRNDAWNALTPKERAAIEAAKRDLQSVYHGNDHRVINDKIESLNKATMALAENMMNTAVRGALKGTKVE
jgi:molecular chaperone DnaK